MKKSKTDARYDPQYSLQDIFNYLNICKYHLQQMECQTFIYFLQKQKIYQKLFKIFFMNPISRRSNINFAFKSQTHKNNTRTLYLMHILNYCKLNDKNYVFLLTKFLYKLQSIMIGACYQNKNSLGIAIYNPIKITITCSQKKFVIPLDQPQIYDTFQYCSNLLTNNPQSSLLSRLIHDKKQELTINEINEKGLQEDTIENNLMKLKSHGRNFEIKNIRQYFAHLKKENDKFKALGMILYYIYSNTQKIQTIFLEDIQYHSDDILKQVSISQRQYEFLEISKQEIHPSMIKGKGKSKEGFSLLNIYQSYTYSTGAKKVMQNIFMNPTFDKRRLQERYQLISWLRQNLHDRIKNQKQVLQIKTFKGLSPIQNVLKKFSSMIAEQEDWRKLMRTLQSIISLFNSLKAIKGDGQSIPYKVSKFIQNPNFDNIRQLFLTFEATISFSPIKVNQGVSQQLDKLRYTYDNMPHLLSLYVQQQKWNFPFRITFMAQVGYLIKIQHYIDEQLPEDWSLQFVNSSGKYYSNSLTERLDQQYGDIYGEIQDIEQKIFFDLQSFVIDKQSFILELYWEACQIECFWAIAQVSKTMCVPKLSSQALIVSNSWHPLLGQNAIDNHYFSFNHKQKDTPIDKIFNSQQNIVNTNYTNRCMIVSGPNGSGKSVYLKQLGTIMFMAHIGILVPAELAEIPLIDKIICTGQTQSLYRGECGFIHQLSSLLDICTPGFLTNKSLILVDQLGSGGITYKHSIKLLNALIRHLTRDHQINKSLTESEIQIKSPLTLIVTHLTQMLTSKLLEENEVVRYLTMEVEVGNFFLYKVKPGLVKKGYGIKGAQKIYPGKFIENANKYWHMIKNYQCK